MIMALDVGNSQIFGGVFDGDSPVLRFRKNTHSGSSSDEIGLFLISVLKENGIDPKAIDRITLCSVVPDVVHSLRGACHKYFDCQPFMLQAGVRTGLKIKYRNPLEVGADRIANAIAGVQLWPGQNLLIIDLGTATTLCAITREREYLGGTILPGLRISMEALESRTAKLPSVEILACEEVLGRSTVESIQSGLYFSHLFALKGLTQEIRETQFSGEPVRVIGTGGFARLFEKQNLFDVIEPDLVLNGLLTALKMN